VSDLLVVRELTLRFGGVTAIQGVSFDVAAGELFAIIGPNGAGKTSIFNCLNGVYRPSPGSIRLHGRELVGQSPARIAHLGIARTFQNLALFPALTVLENVMVGANSLGGSSKTRRKEARAILDRFALAHLADSYATGLPYGTLKRIEFARALAGKPRLLMLDEPAAGLTHSEVDELGELIRSLRDEYSLSVLLVEHHMAMVMAISEKIVVLDFGSKIAEGGAAEISANPRVIEAYLGTPPEDAGPAQ